jgi:glycosyltransferase involved in cell wall biosynthesis
MPGLVLNKRICFISSRSGFITSEGSVSMDWANGRLIYELSREFGNSFSVAIFSDPTHNSNYNFLVSVSKIYPLPFPFSYVGGMKNIFRISKLLSQIEEQNDLLVIQLPFIGFPALLKIKKPTVFHLCANVLTAAQNPFKYKGLAKIISQSFAQYIHRVNRRLFNREHCRVIVNGSELGTLYKEFKPVAAVSSSVYSVEMIAEENINTRAEHSEFVILFIGRPSKEKGFHTLIEAFINLVDGGELVTLKLLGVRREELETILGTQIAQSYSNRIEFLGFISWGEKFRSIVQSSHCLVVSSVSEGTPRVLIEARALGCPVIATNIGGIVTSVENLVDGILINPGKSKELSSAIISLFDEQLRIELARRGLMTAKKYSLEMFVNNFKNAVRDLQLK